MIRRDADPLRLVRLVLDRDGQQRVGLRVEQVVDAGRDRLEPDRGDDPQPGRLGPEQHAHRLPRPGLCLLRLGTLGVATPLQLAEGLLRLGQLSQERLVRVRVIAGIECGHQPADQAGLLLDLLVQSLSRRMDHLHLLASCWLARRSADARPYRANGSLGNPRSNSSARRRRKSARSRRASRSRSRVIWARCSRRVEAGGYGFREPAHGVVGLGVGLLAGVGRPVVGSQHARGDGPVARGVVQTDGIVAVELFPQLRRLPAAGGILLLGERPQTQVESERHQSRIDDLPLRTPQAVVDDRHGLGRPVKVRQDSARGCACSHSVSGWSGPSFAFCSASVSSRSFSASVCRPRAA